MLGTSTVAAALDGRFADLSPPARAVLPLLEKQAQAHDELVAADVAAVLDAGVTPEALRQALDVAWAFHIINRLADAFEFHVGEDAMFDVAARMLLKRGYR